MDSGATEGFLDPFFLNNFRNIDVDIVNGI